MFHPNHVERISSSSDMSQQLHGQPTPTVLHSEGGNYYGDDHDMDTDDNMESTVDSSTLQPFTPQSVNNYNYEESYPSPQMAKMKGKKAKMKKVKTDEDEEIDVEKFINEEVGRIAVKFLRKLIPKLRILCYYSDNQVSGKRKLKHLWDEKPPDWPEHVAFKDPNNAIKDGQGQSVKKPGKEELRPMFEFLQQKYRQMKGYSSATIKSDTGVTDSYRMPVMVESSQDQGAFYLNSYANRQVHTMPQYVIHQTASEDLTSGGQMSFKYEMKEEVLSPPTTGHYKSLQATSSGAADWQLVPTQTERPVPVMIQPQQEVTTVQQMTAVTTVPAPVKELYDRLEHKKMQIITQTSFDKDVVSMLTEVHREVIECLYRSIGSSDTRICLMFLDAGHQLEALLDVMSVLGHVDVTLLHNGCQEIIKKFNREAVSVQQMLLLPGIEQRQLPFMTALSQLTLDSKQDKEESLLDMLGLGTDSKSSFPMKQQQPAQQLYPEMMGDLTGLLGINPKKRQDVDLKKVVEETVQQRSVTVEQLDDNDEFLKDLLNGKQDVDNEVFQELMASFYDHPSSCKDQDKTKLADYEILNNDPFMNNDATAMPEMMDEDLNDLVSIISQESGTQQQPFHQEYRLEYQQGYHHQQQQAGYQHNYEVASMTSYRQESSAQSAQESRFMPSTNTRTPLIPSHVANATIADFESDENSSTMTARQPKISRAGGRTGKSMDGRRLNGKHPF